MLKEYISQIAPLDKKEWAAFQHILKREHFPKKQVFLLEGQICYHSAFLEKGLFKLSLTGSKGDEKIIQLNPENTFFSDCESYQHEKCL